MIVGVVVAVVASGLTAGVLATGSGATQRHTGAPAPQVVQVREQDLDGNGNIRVHEQGVAAVQVAASPSQKGKLFDNVTVPAAPATVTTDLTVAGFKTLTLLGRMGARGALQFPIYIRGYEDDGTTLSPVTIPQQFSNVAPDQGNNTAYEVYSFPLLGLWKVQVAVQNQDSIPQPVTVSYFLDR
jgi:hypothetical protein